MLDADALPQRGGVAARIETEHRDRPVVRVPVALHAFHRRRLACAVRADEAENFAFEYFERHVIHRDGGTMRFPR